MAVFAGRRVFRVCRARYARLDGTGARLVYMAESIALAVLEKSGAHDQTRLPARLRLWPLCSPMELA